MVKVDTLCTCLRLAPVGLLLAVHCSPGHWSTDDEARERALRYGFSVSLFPERPLSVLTHIFVHVSTEHLLSNVFSLASTLLEFGGEDSMKDNLEEDEIPVVAQRSLGSLIVMTLGGVLGGLGGQLAYNNSKVAKRKEEAQRLLSEQQKLKSSSSASAANAARERERVVGEPRKGMSKIRKPNMSRLWTDEGSIHARGFFGQKTGGGAKSQPPPPPPAPSGGDATASVPASPRPTEAQPPSRSPRPTPVSEAATSPAAAYTAALRSRIIHKMRGFVESDALAGSGEEEYVYEAPRGGGDVTHSSHSGGGSSGSGSTDGVISRMVKSVKLSAQAWGANKAAEAQALLNRNMLMCGASAGICALSGFNLTYYRRPVTALCLAVPEMLILAHEMFYSSGTGAKGLAASWKTLLPGQTVGHAAHVGGFVVGCLMGYVWRFVAPLSQERAQRRRAERRRRQREEEERAASQQWHPRASNSSSTGGNGSSSGGGGRGSRA